jgi:hypothetical protein
MRAREFTINVPITITINGDGDPEIDMPGQEQDEAPLQNNPVMVNPLQQELELKKAELGKQSPVIDKMVQSDNLGAEESDNDTTLLKAIKQLIDR